MPYEQSQRKRTQPGSLSSSQVLIVREKVVSDDRSGQPADGQRPPVLTD